VRFGGNARHPKHVTLAPEIIQLIALIAQASNHEGKCSMMCYIVNKGVAMPSLPMVSPQDQRQAMTVQNPTITHPQVDQEYLPAPSANVLS
jgi:hypothetical protein